MRHSIRKNSAEGKSVKIFDPVSGRYCGGMVIGCHDHLLRIRLARPMHAGCGQEVRLAIGGLGSSALRSGATMVKAAVMSGGILGRSPWIQLRLTATASAAVAAA